MELRTIVEATSALPIVMSVFVIYRSFKAGMRIIDDPTIAVSEAEAKEEAIVGTREGSNQIFFRTSVD